MKDNGIHPKTTMLPILCNGAIFMAMFFAIRGMATLPVKSMEAGGLYWFTDLTIADPYFILPIITASSLLIHLKVGGDGLNLDALPPFIKKLMLVMPIISIPFMCAFPAVIWLHIMAKHTSRLTSLFAGFKSILVDVQLGDNYTS